MATSGRAGLGLTIESLIYIIDITFSMKKCSIEVEVNLVCLVGERARYRANLPHTKQALKVNLAQAQTLDPHCSNSDVRIMLLLLAASVQLLYYGYTFHLGQYDSHTV